MPVPIDTDGVRPDLLADAFAMTGTRLLYCRPTFHNPTGTVLALERRRQVLVARGPVTERMRAVRTVDDFFISRPLQEAALELLTSPTWDRHVRTLGAELRERRSRLTAALAHEMPTATLTHAPAGGLHLWLRLPPGVDDTALTAAARHQGVAVSAGNRYFATEPPAAHLRLSFAATPDLTELDEGARRLGAVLRDHDWQQR